MLEDKIYERAPLIKAVIIGAIALVVILLFVFIILPLFRDDESNSSSLYNSNVKKMQNAVEDYINNNASNFESSVTTLTLQEMYDQELLTELKDSDGNSCVTSASFAIITRLEDSYRIEVTLVCGDNHEKTTSYKDIEAVTPPTDDDEEEPADDNNNSNNNNSNNNNNNSGSNSGSSNNNSQTPTKEYVNLYRFKRIVTTRTWGEWSEWSETPVSGDETESKKQYYGRIWDSSHGAYVFTDGYVDELPAGYEIAKERYVYRARNYVVKEKVEYTESYNSYIGDEWTLVEVIQVEK